MILLKLKRDQARAIEEHLFPLMIRIAEMKVNTAGKFSDEYLNYKIVLTLLTEVKKIFTRKLDGAAHKFNFKFNDAQGITLFKFLMNHRISEEHSWLINLRQHICDVLYKQIIK